MDPRALELEQASESFGELVSSWISVSLASDSDWRETFQRNSNSGVVWMVGGGWGASS